MSISTLQRALTAAQELDAPVTLTLRDGSTVTGHVVHATREAVQMDTGTVPYEVVACWALRARGEVAAGASA